MAAAGVDRQPAAQVDLTTGHERPALALLAEAPILELQQDGDGEAVVDLGHVDVVRPESGPPVERFGHGGGRQFGDRLPHQHRELDPRLRVGNAALGHGPDQCRRLP